MNLGEVAVERVEVRVVRLPLVRPFATAHGSTVERDVLLVHAVGDGVDGWGECAAESVPTYWYETIDTVRAALPRLVAGEDIVGNPMARAALEMATLDVRGRTSQRSVAALLGGTRRSVDATATAGFEDDVDAFAAAGYRSIKVKVSPSHAELHLVDGVAMQADANGSFADDEPALDALDNLGLACIEQPLDPDDLRAHAELRRRLRTPICLDESIASRRDLDAVLALDACDVVCVKASRLGGLRAGVEVHDRCVAEGIDAKVGGMLETGIGRAAALALASLPGFTFPADLSASDRYWANDLTEPFVLQPDGTLLVPEGPGLGIEVDLDLIERATVTRAVIPVGRS